MVEKIPQHSSWLLPPTPKQVRAITKLCLRFNISEPLEEQPRTRREARQLIYRLREQGKEDPQWSGNRAKEEP